MSTEDNKKVVAEFFRLAPATGNLDMFAEDVSFWVAGSGTAYSGMKNKQQLQGLLASLSEIGAGPFTIVPTHMIAEGNFVAAEAKGHLKLKDGRVYNNLYHFVFEIHDGKITTGREYNDTDHVRQLFGT